MPSRTAQHDRFEFGRNWITLLSTLDEGRVATAEESLRKLLGVQNLNQRTFLDVGCGSGLFSLAARRMGASVTSFDYDLDSVACTAELRRRFFPDDSSWAIEEGSILDEDYVRRLGQFDAVYAWGVLHHTGNMQKALYNVQLLVKEQGKLAIAIYNDQGSASRRWSWVKKTYNRVPLPLKRLLLGLAFLRLWGPTMVRDVLKGSPGQAWPAYHQERGMSPWRDVVDWVGGYPFEFAKPEAIVERFLRGPVQFEMISKKTCGSGHGCNEFVFYRSDVIS